LTAILAYRRILALCWTAAEVLGSAELVGRVGIEPTTN
jgi:hypothetical protein